MATPIINFVGISGQNVSAEYENLPAGSEVVFVNKTSGQTMTAPVIPAAGSESIVIDLPTGFPSGAFYLKAQDSTGAYLAQSVEFYVA